MKMRKWIISVLAVLLVIALAGCAIKEEKAKPKKAPEPLVINTKDKKKDYSDKEAKAAEAAKKAKEEQAKKERAKKKSRWDREHLRQKLKLHREQVVFPQENQSIS